MTTPVPRIHYGDNSIMNPLLTDDSVPYSGEPNGYIVTCNGTMEYENIWDIQDGFSGTPKRIIIHTLAADAYIELASKKFALAPVYECNRHVETCHYMRYRFAFEYAATFAQMLTIKYYNMVKRLLRTDVLTLPATEATIYSTTIDVPNGAYLDEKTAYIQFTFKATTTIDYTISNLRFNQYLFTDMDIPPEPILPYATDRMNRCFSSDVYDITALDQIHQALVSAIASQIDKARSVVLTILNNLYVNYMNNELIDEVGALFNMPRYALEDDRDYLYKERIDNLWPWGYGGGCKAWITNLLQYFINWDVQLTCEAMEPSGSLIEYEPFNSKTDPQPYAQALDDCDLLELLRDEVMAGVFVAGDYIIKPALVSGECNYRGGWVGNGIKGVDAGSLVTNLRGK